KQTISPERTNAPGAAGGIQAARAACAARARSGEEADTTGADEEADDDEDDAPEQLLADDRDDARNNEDCSKDPKEGSHVLVLRSPAAVTPGSGCATGRVSVDSDATRGHSGKVQTFSKNSGW